ncbi:hypothetical protein [Iningainema tapete]|uniref:Uncharacterized protein n=1 Tax=Iningainema tapete BLCC-T55 TaxID=2748662 RepID=A0A8J7BZV7_9CYAN|nr:hypothetical protein [Iningainema tapete]MBD2776793.1 hypothetical protein [Iningainema tapete BLCC-T55]
MISGVSSLNVQDLQQNAINSLEKISCLMHRASTGFGSHSTNQKYADFEKQVSLEADKVKNLELRMAIVAPMKAGKSTIINAIVGQERFCPVATLP